jgi:hypothetical protein
MRPNRRGEGDSVQPVDLVAVGDPLAMLVMIGPAAPGAAAAVAWLVVRAVTKHPFLAFPYWS